MKNPTARKSGRQGGFTLLECLVALLIVALVVGGALFQVSLYANQRAGLQDRVAAHTVAWNRLMDQYLLVNGWVPAQTGPAERSGQTRIQERDWHWEIAAESTLASGFYRYEVRVFPVNPDSGSDGSDARLASLLAAYFIAD